MAARLALVGLLLAACDSTSPSPAATQPSAGTVDVTTATIAPPASSPPSTPAHTIEPGEQITWPAPSATPAILSFTASPRRVRKGDVVTLIWSTAGATSVTIRQPEDLGGRAPDFGPLPASGTLTTTISDILSTRYYFVLTLDDDVSASVDLETTCEEAWDLPNANTVACPAPSTHPSAVAQRFERGVIVWVEALNTYYIFAPNRPLLGASAPLQPKPGASVDNRVGETPPPGYYEPTGDFGLLWRDEVEGVYLEGVRQALGWAARPESRYEAVYQCMLPRSLQTDLAPSYVSLSGCYLSTPEGATLHFYDMYRGGSPGRIETVWEEIGGIAATPTPVSGVEVPGILDPTFDGDGILTTDFGSAFDSAGSFVVQHDGKIIVAGSIYAEYSNIAVARYNPDGTLDTTFDGDGIVTTDIAGFHDTAQAVILQDDGKIVVAGSATYTSDAYPGDFALVRYHPDGALDASFGTGGKVTTDIAGSDDHARAVAIQPDGKIVVVGTTAVPGNVDFALARYNPDGTLDTPFGGDGMVTTDLGSTFDQVNAAVLQDDGKIIVAGSVHADFDNFALARYNADGSLDATLDGDGLVTTDVAGSSDAAQAVALQRDGKIVAAGFTYNSFGTRDDFALVRFNGDGSLDVAFDGDGKVVVDFAGSQDRAQAVLIQRDGKIVAAGAAQTRHGEVDFALARFNADGTLDAAFGSGGKVTTQLVDGGWIWAATLQPDGKIVVAGSIYADTGALRGLALARYHP